MNRFIAVVASNQDAYEQQMNSIGEVLTAISSTGRLAIGLGEYGPRGRALTKQRPLESTAALPSFSHLKQGGIGLLTAQTLEQNTPFRATQTSPFKFKRWLWSLSGTLLPRPDAEGQVLPIPGYIMSQRKGTRPEEEVFLQFLAFLHSYGELGKRRSSNNSMGRALTAALSLLPSRYSDPSGENPRVCVCVSDGRALNVLACGRPLWMQTLGETTDRGLGDDARYPLGRLPTQSVAITDVAPANPTAWQELGGNVELIVDQIGRYRIDNG